MSLVIGYVALVVIVAGLPVGLWARLPARRRRRTGRYLAHLDRIADRHLARLAESRPMPEDRSANWCHSHNCPLGQCPQPEPPKPPEQPKTPTK